MIITNNRADWRKLAYLFLTGENGQGLVECVVILAVISLATTLGLCSVGKSTNNDITELQGGMDPNASEVVFQTEDGERISRGFYSSYNPIVIPEVPDKEGTSGKYWSLDGETIATEEEIRSAMTSGRQIVLSPIYAVNLTVTGSGFKIAGFEDDPDGSIVRTNLSREVIIGKTYTLTYCSDELFLYWKDGLEHIVSTNQNNYSFALATNKTLVAVSKLDDNSVEVYFTGASNQVYSTHNYAKETIDNTTIDIPVQVPTHIGRTFVGWKVPGYENPMTGQALKDAIKMAVKNATGASINVKAEFKAPDETIPVTIIVDGNTVETIAASIGLYSYKLNTQENVKWYYVDENNEMLISESKLVYYQVTDKDTAITLKAVTSDEASAPLAVIERFYSEKTASGEYKIYIIGLTSVPQGFTGVERGILYSTTPKDEESLVRENINNGVIASSTSGGAGSYNQTFTMKEKNLDRVLYIRAYVSYTDAQGEHVAYSDVMSGSYNSQLISQNSGTP